MVTYSFSIRAQIYDMGNFSVFTSLQHQKDLAEAPGSQVGVGNSTQIFKFIQLLSNLKCSVDWSPDLSGHFQEKLLPVMSC